MNINKDIYLYLSSIIVTFILINYSFDYVSGQIDIKSMNLSNNIYYLNWREYNPLGFIPIFEYVLEIDSDQLFPDHSIRDKVLETNKKVEYTIPSLQYELLGFKINATNVQVITESFQESEGDRNQLRINFLVMSAKNVNVKDRMIDLSFDNIDLSSTYVIYDSLKNVFSIHIPIHIALRYLP